jgi:hypothetical protein
MRGIEPELVPGLVAGREDLDRQRCARVIEEVVALANRAAVRDAVIARDAEVEAADADEQGSQSRARIADRAYRGRQRTRQVRTRRPS